MARRRRLSGSGEPLGFEKLLGCPRRKARLGVCQGDEAQSVARLARGMEREHFGGDILGGRAALRRFGGQPLGHFVRDMHMQIGHLPMVSLGCSWLRMGRVTILMASYDIVCRRSSPSRSFGW